LTNSLIISFQYNIESVYFFYSDPVFRLGGGTVSPSCWTYLGLMILGRQKYT